MLTHYQLQDASSKTLNFKTIIFEKKKHPDFYAGVAKLVDAPDLGSGAARRVGSIPITRTKF